jgi:hypothetical protein
MKTKFVVLNPLTGIYTDAATEAERDLLLAKFSWDFYMSQTHQKPYSSVIVHDDGSEVWSAPDGEVMLSPEQLRALWEDAIIVDATKVEILP